MAQHIKVSTIKIYYLNSFPRTYLPGGENQYMKVFCFFFNITFKMFYGMHTHSYTYAYTHAWTINK